RRSRLADGVRQRGPYCPCLLLSVLRGPTLIGSDEAQRPRILSRVVSVPVGQSPARITKSDFDVEIGRSVVQQADGFSDDKARGAPANEGDGGPFARQIAPATNITTQLAVTGGSPPPTLR